MEKVFNQRSNTEERLRLKKYYIAFEGSVTEPEYFKGLIKYRDKIGIDAVFEIIPLSRFTSEKTNSSPDIWCIPLLEKTMEEYKSKKMSLDSLVSHAIDWVVQTSRIKGKNNTRALRDIKSGIIAEFKKSGYLPQDLIEQSELKNFITNLCEYIESVCELNMHSKAIVDLRKYVNNQRGIYSERSDKVCLIIDRDKKSFTPDTKYDSTVSECHNKKIKLFVSNPKFEFWILLHSKDIDVFDSIKLKSDSSYLDTCLKEAFPLFSKTSIHFESLADNIGVAIENESHYCENVNKLKDELGSNIGLLIKELMNK